MFTFHYPSRGVHLPLEGKELHYEERFPRLCRRTREHERRLRV